MTIVMITHFMEEAAEADRVAVFRAGHVAMLGTPEEILTRADELAQLNLDIPESCRLGRSLRAKGVPVCAQVREADMVAEIAQLMPSEVGQAPQGGLLHPILVCSTTSPLQPTGQPCRSPSSRFRTSRIVTR